MAPAESEELSLPRILCLHGGGVTGAIFKAQFRSFLKALGDKFRFVFVDAPFFCEEGVGVKPVYEDWGPFRRWFRWLPEHDQIDNDSCAYEIEYAIERAVEGDPGTGEWTGLLGFSQGAKLAASLLYEQQVATDAGETPPGPNWRFAVIMAGRAPMVSLSSRTEAVWMQPAGETADNVDLEAIKDHPDRRLRLPTIHVHGTQDPSHHLHQRLLHDYCDPESTILVEWDGNHRVPLKNADVEKVVKAILELTRRLAI